MTELAGRSYARVYRVVGREDVHAFLLDAVERSGGRILYASPPDRAPLFLGVQTAGGDRLGLLIYHFRMTGLEIRNRPEDEVRGQIRYGGEKSWVGEHPVAQDIAGVDITLMLGIHVQGGVLVGLQPALYDPLPMGISFYVKAEQLARARELSWTAWEHETAPGPRRAEARAEGLETMVSFTPERLLDYALFERRASDLGLDQPLRHRLAADSAARYTAQEGSAAGQHVLEEEFSLSSREILEIIATRRRLRVAALGGVAEHKLEEALRADAAVRDVKRLDLDGEHDFDVTLSDERKLRVECKNASPTPYANGDYKVEVQKTRASTGDPASRYYKIDQFDVVAACLYSPTQEWTFRFQATSRLTSHAKFPDRLAAMQRVTPEWAETPGGVET